MWLSPATEPLGPVLFGKDEGWNVDPLLRSKKIRAVPGAVDTGLQWQLTER